MCTLILHFDPDAEWPLLVAGNRDEMRDRSWRAPARHWPDRPEVVAGLDELAGGSWFGVTQHGVVASILNREGTLGPSDEHRSRGELVLEALDHGSASAAADALAELEPSAYKGFNLIVADPQVAYWVVNDPSRSPALQVHEIPPGSHMIAARDLNDESTPRLERWLGHFQQAAIPKPEEGLWQDWQNLLARRDHPEDEPFAAMNVEYMGRYGTVCSQLLAVPRYPGYPHRPRFLFADGPPDRVEFRVVDV